MAKRYVQAEPASTLVQEAMLYKRCVDEGMTHGKIAERFNRHRTHVANMVGLLEALPHDILTYMASPPSDEARLREGVHEVTMSHARNLKGLKGFPTVQMALFERIKLDGVSVRFCELALSAFTLGTQRGMTINEIADGILECPKNADDPAQFLHTTTLHSEPQQPKSALELDPECIYLLARISQEMQVECRFERGNVIIALQDRPDLLKRIARLLVGPTGVS